MYNNAMGRRLMLSIGACLFQISVRRGVSGLSISASINLKQIPRLFVPSPSALSKGSNVFVSPDQSHYLNTVLRKSQKKGGAERYIRVFDGQSGEWLCVGSTTTTNDSFTPDRKRRSSRGGRGDIPQAFECVDQLRLQLSCMASSTGPTLIFAPIKKQRAKLLIEKCTELGVGNFQMIYTEYTDSKNGVDSMLGIEKLSLQAVEAAEQSERLSVPQFLFHGDGLSPVCSIDEVINQHSDKKLIVCRERSDPLTTPSIMKIFEKDVEKCGILVGPEGGWSPEEEKYFDEAEHEGRIQSATLGNSVLRSETASISALVAWNLSRLG